MVTPKISTEAISTNKIIDTKMRDRKENLLNKGWTFRSKLANIAPKRVQNQVQAQMVSFQFPVSSF
jgi:transglutaminase/protease-like cytokinesis protein 3